MRMMTWGVCVCVQACAFLNQVNRILEKRVLEKTEVPLHSQLNVMVVPYCTLCSHFGFVVFLKESIRVCCKERGSCIFSSTRTERGKCWCWWHRMAKVSQKLYFQASYVCKGESEQCEVCRERVKKLKVLMKKTRIPFCFAHLWQCVSCASQTAKAQDRLIGWRE